MIFEAFFSEYHIGPAILPSGIYFRFSRVSIIVLRPQGHTWTVSGYAYSPEIGRTTVAPSLDAATSLVAIPSTTLFTAGLYYVKLNVTSTPDDYSFVSLSPPIRALPASYVRPSADVTKLLAFSIRANYQAVVGTNAEDFIALVWNYFGPTNQDAWLGNIRVTEGEKSKTIHQLSFDSRTMVSSLEMWRLHLNGIASRCRNIDIR